MMPVYHPIEGYFEEKEDGTRIIYRGYIDTERSYVHVQCPHCRHEQKALYKNECGETYTIKCRKCGKDYLMRFDMF